MPIPGSDFLGNNIMYFSLSLCTYVYTERVRRYVCLYACVCVRDQERESVCKCVYFCLYLHMYVCACALVFMCVLMIFFRFRPFARFCHSLFTFLYFFSNFVFYTTAFCYDFLSFLFTFSVEYFCRTF